MAKKQLKYVMCRTHAMGVFAGELESNVKGVVVLRNARRIWYWAGAASLSQLATDGTSKPGECKFPCAVDRVELMSPNGFEILDITSKAKESILSVPVWSK